MTEAGPKSTGSPNHVGELRSAIFASVEAVPIGSVQDVEQHFGRVTVGTMADVLYQQLKTIVPSNLRTGFDTHSLRAVAGAFRLDQALGAEPDNYADVLTAVVSGLSAGTELKPPHDPCWIEAATIGRALLALGVYQQADPRHIAVADAAARLVGKGFALKRSGVGVDWASPAIEDVTAAIVARFAKLGLIDVLSNLFGAARRSAVYALDQYLFGRRYSFEARKPSIPFGFLLNLAVKVPDQQTLSSRPDTDWREIIELSRDLVSVLDVEPYNQLWMINSTPPRIGRLLSEVGLYDHLFGVRQWPIFVTPLFSRELLRK
jgi:hypothetical protein